jgi:hypothetical protein
MYIDRFAKRAKIAILKKTDLSLIEEPPGV